MGFEMSNEYDLVTQIKVVGVGGGGGNAVNHMVVSEVQGVEFISLNTDRQALMKSKATVKTVIGEKTCKGGGAGGNRVENIVFAGNLKLQGALAVRGIRTKGGISGLVIGNFFYIIIVDIRMSEGNYLTRQILCDF